MCDHRHQCSNIFFMINMLNVCRTLAKKLSLGTFHINYLWIDFHIHGSQCTINYVKFTSEVSEVSMALGLDGNVVF